MTSQKVTVKNKLGLHARPAGVFVRTAQQFESGITMRVKGAEFPCKSMIRVMQAGAVRGTEIEIIAEGADEQQAVQALVAAVEAGLEDEV